MLASVPLGWISIYESSANETLHCYLFGHSIPTVRGLQIMILVTGNNQHALQLWQFPHWQLVPFSWNQSGEGQTAGLERIHRDASAQYFLFLRQYPQRKGNS